MDLKKNVSIEEGNIAKRKAEDSASAEAKPNNKRNSTKVIEVAELAKNNLSCFNNSDEAYFRGYENTGIHQQMIGDYSRTNAYREAILKNYQLFYGKVVLDVGCGTGILSVFCVQAGAKKVYGIEASRIADEAKAVIKSNKMEDKIEIIQAKIEDVILPEKVDIIVSEWMGYMLLYESMLESLLLARDKWLKTGGKMFPEKAQLYISLVTKTEQWLERVDFWYKMKDLHKVDMSAMIERATDEMCGHVTICCVFPDQIISHPIKLLEIDLSNCSYQNLLENLVLPFELSSFGDETVRAFAVWFDVQFPQEFTLSTSPYQNDTHWHQTVFYIEPESLKQDTIVRGKISIEKNPLCNRFLVIGLNYNVNGGKEKNYSYDLNCDSF